MTRLLVARLRWQSTNCILTRFKFHLVLTIVQAQLPEEDEVRKAVDPLTGRDGVMKDEKAGIALLQKLANTERSSASALQQSE